MTEGKPGISINFYESSYSRCKTKLITSWLDEKENRFLIKKIIIRFLQIHITV